MSLICVNAFFAVNVFTVKLFFRIKYNFHYIKLLIRILLKKEPCLYQFIWALHSSERLQHTDSHQMYSHLIVTEGIRENWITRLSSINPCQISRQNRDWTASTQQLHRMPTCACVFFGFTSLILEPGECFEYPMYEI